MQAKKLEEVSTALAAQLASMRAEIKNEVKAQLGTVVAGQITIINEELLAHGQRMPSAQQVAVLTSTMEIDAVKDLVPAGGGAFLVPFDQRSMDEVRVAVARALSLSQIRHCHSLAVCLTVLRLGVTAPAVGDGLTCFFSPASKQAWQNSHAIKNFKRVNIAVLNKLITDMGTSGYAPAVFQGQARVVPSRIGRFEDAALSFIRNSLNDGRSLGREPFYRGPAYALEKENGRIKVRMAFPDVFKPAFSAAFISKYIVARITLVASPSGRVGAAATAAVDGEDMPLLLEDVRHAVRNICTYKLASDMLPAMVGHGFDFDARDIFSVTVCISTVMVKGKGPWRAAVRATLSPRTTISLGVPGRSGLLLPRMSKRLQLDVLIQTLSTDELFPGSAVLPAMDADDLDCEDNDDDDDIDVLGA